MKPMLLPCLIAGLLLAGVSGARAGVVFSNLAQDSVGDMPVANNPSLFSESTPYVGSSFTVGTDFTNWSLDSVTLKMDSAGTSTTGTFSVAIYADTSDGSTSSKPGTLLGTLAGSAAPVTAGDYVYNATPGSIQLTAGSTYWLVAQASATSGGNQGYNWLQSDGLGYSASAGWSIDPTRAMTVFHSDYTTDSGSWYDNTASTSDNIIYRADSAGGSAQNLGQDSFLQFSISASVSGAPEPSKAVFALLGLLTLGLRRRRVRGEE